MRQSKYAQSPGWHKRQRVWYHNGLLGRASMMVANCTAIRCAPTATTEAKLIAAQIYPLACQLRAALKERVDNDGQSA